MCPKESRYISLFQSELYTYGSLCFSAGSLVAYLDLYFPAETAELVTEDDIVFQINQNAAQFSVSPIAGSLFTIDTSFTRVLFKRRIEGCVL